MLGELSADRKKAFAKWVAVQSLKEMKDILEPNEYIQFRQEVAGGGIFWTATPSMAVAIALARQDGSIYLNRLLFGDSVKDWTDDEMWTMLKAKDDDATSDYRVAFDMVWETQDPKAPKPSAGSVAPTATTVSSDSSPKTIHSDSPTIMPAA